MVIIWFLRAGATVVGWLLGSLPDLPEFTLPDPMSFGVPVAWLPGWAIDAMNVWLAVAIPVGIALIVGRLIQWLYHLIPLNGGG